ncbi:hypothetical protein CRG98_039057 [Punica granatum]|uniref:DUF4283 domain-containing protein n=1 Tax=Punica granatum TaxID=22663 RepID=A0A2I0I984_PUNGR|nr:hypothetical protein CRG98_039057 [Punica granatum]
MGLIELCPKTKERLDKGEGDDAYYALYEDDPYPTVWFEAYSFELSTLKQWRISGVQTHVHELECNPNAAVKEVHFSPQWNVNFQPYNLTSPLDGEEVLLNGPYNIGAIVLIVLRLYPSIGAPNLGFTQVPFWIKLKEMPMHLQTSRTSLLFSDRVLDIEVDMVPHPQARVKLNLEAPSLQSYAWWRASNYMK